MYLLDTNTVIDFCNSKLPEQSKNLLFKIRPNLSVITQIELFASSKISEKERNILIDFVNFSNVYSNIDNAIVNKTIEIRQKFKTKLPDAIIAATAIINNLILITRNIDDFKGIDQLETLNPHQ
jgi:predicted nucleic acid-binding protein